MKKNFGILKNGFLNICFITVFGLIACAPRVTQYGFPVRQYAYQVPEKTDDGWEVSSLSREGVDTGKINELMHRILDEDIKNIHSVLLVKKGKLVLEEYFHGYEHDTKHIMASASKSITSVLVGMAINQKMISSVDTKVYEFFPEHQDTKWIDQKYDIALKHVLTMSAGLDWNAWKYSDYDRRNTTTAMAQSDDWIKFVLNKKNLEAPGKYFTYNNGLTMLLGGIIKNTTGLKADEFAEKYLFDPLDISDYSWAKSPDGAVNTAWGLSLTPRDMAKIGYLFLKKGSWKGKQIVSRAWVSESTRPYLTRDVLFGSGYGYQWWNGKTVINKQHIETFYAAGHGGQYIFICPELDLVAVITSKYLGNTFGEFRPQIILVNYLLPAVLPPFQPRKAIELGHKDLDAYIGKYQYKKWKLNLTVRKEGDKLYCKFLGKKFEIFPQKESQFSGFVKEIGDVKIKFIKDGKQNLDYLLVYFGFANLQFDKIK
jgi:CubicO group peptidase (beta-lactamase class C family)